MRADHHRSRNESPADANATATTTMPRTVSSAVSLSGIVVSTILRNTSGGARSTTAATTMVTTKPTSMARYGRASRSTRRPRPDGKEAPSTLAGSDRNSMWGP